MTVDEGAPPVGALPRPEALAIRDIVTRLRAALPAVDEATVEAAVRSAYDSFRRARVRTYVPILAERRARDMLGAPAGRRQRGTGE
ncbi:three-helix bundle dimerization domain-containing protein [Streptomyces scabiei]|uniref:three-helix bundle dimerization domain-containing protein n=1 Tax=Streptomyces scabiei TaxID=1930 RepID=UPI0039F6C8F5